MLCFPSGLTSTKDAVSAELDGQLSIPLVMVSYLARCGCSALKAHSPSCG